MNMSTSATAPYSSHCHLYTQVHSLIIEQVPDSLEDSPVHVATIGLDIPSL